ncbi:TIGR03084 family metal-binding protein, partial [Streptomyces boncukensis]
MTTGAVLDDMRAEGAELERLLLRGAGLDPARWALPTPSPGWSVAHQIAHLAWTDEQSVRAATDPDAFRRETRRMLNAAGPGGALLDSVDQGAADGARQPSGELLERWRASREALGRALAAQPEGARMPWYVKPMSVAGMAGARIMEMWAHGEDVAAALGEPHPVTDRLAHVVRLGTRARDSAYAAHGLEPPAEPVRVEVTAPGGRVWAFGPEDAAQRVTGDAVDFCRLVTQRVHRDDAEVRAEGAEAERWLGIAQAFAGPPGAGRPRA